MVGENPFEQHCETELNKIALPTAFQELDLKKTIDSKSGSKGDFIYIGNDERG